MRKPECEKQETNKGAWTKEEDQRLIDHIQIHGEGCWRTVPKASGLRRSGKSCRLRWMNYLRPNLKRGNFGQDEDDLIIKLHALLGNRWSLIAGRLPGRTDNEIKNYWNAHLKKKLMAHGIDPKNHRLSQTLPYPRNHDITNFSTTSSESINDGFSMLRTQVGNHNQLSNITSWLEEDTCGSVNLSLNLTEEMESDERRTLLLFR